MSVGTAMIGCAKNAEVDLAGYRFYRSRVSGGPWTLAYDLVGTPNSPITTLTDFSADGVWYFIITAYDTSANEGSASGQLSKTITRPLTRIQRTAR